MLLTRQTTSTYRSRERHFDRKSTFFRQTQPGERDNLLMQFFHFKNSHHLTPSRPEPSEYPPLPSTSSSPASSRQSPATPPTAHHPAPHRYAVCAQYGIPPHDFSGTKAPPAAHR